MKQILCLLVVFCTVYFAHAQSHSESPPHKVVKYFQVHVVKDILVNFETRELDIKPSCALLDSLVTDYTHVYTKRELRKARNGTVFNYAEWPDLRYPGKKIKMLFVIPKLKDCFFVVRIREDHSYGLEIYYSREYKKTEDDIHTDAAISSKTTIDPDHWESCLRTFAYGIY